MGIIRRHQNQLSSNIVNKITTWTSLMECIKDFGKISSKLKLFVSTKFMTSISHWLHIFLSFNRINVDYKGLK